MAITPVPQYTGDIPEIGQNQPTFNQNTSDMFDYIGTIADGINTTATEIDTASQSVDDNRALAEQAANTATGAVNFAGAFVSGSTSAIAGKSYSFDGGYWVCLSNTTTDPSVTNANWKKALSVDDLNDLERRSTGVGVQYYRGSNGVYVVDGDVVPVGTTHLIVLIDGKTEEVAISPIASGSVSLLTEFGCSINGTPVYFERVKKKTASTLEQFGGKADYYLEDGVTVNPSPTDNYQAWLRLVNSKVKFVGNSVYPSVGEVECGAGAYYFSQPLSMKVVSKIIGVGSGQAGNESTQFIFDGVSPHVGACAGITYQRHTTDETSLSLVASTTGSDGSTLEGMRIVALSKVLQPTTPEYEQINSGLWLRARATCKDVVVEGFGGHGRMVVATTGGVEPAGNANLWKMEKCGSQSCGYHGLYVSGADVNAGESYGEDNNFNSGNGIKDNSFLGNTYISPHLSANYRDEHYVTYDAGSGVQWWWFISSNPSDVSKTPGSDPRVWQLRSSSIVSDSRPWTGSNIMETSGALVSSGSNNFIGVYTEGGSQGPINVNTGDFITITTAGTSVAYISLKRKCTIIGSGTIVNTKVVNAASATLSLPESVEYFVRDNSPERYSYGVINSEYVQVDNIAELRGGLVNVAGLGVAGILHVGVVSTNNPTNITGLRRGDWYVANGVKIGGQSGIRLTYGSILSDSYYRVGDVIFQTGAVSYKQCTVAGIGNSTAVFVDHNL